MPLLVMAPTGFSKIEPSSFARRQIGERSDLQRLLRDDISVLDPDLLVLAEEFADWEDSKRRIDLLAVDRDANLVVIELKRTEDGGHMELQALRYAAMVAQMTVEQAAATLQGHLNKNGREQDAHEVLRQFLGWSHLTENGFGKDVRLVLVSQDFSRELTTTVMWLLERDIDIRCYRMQPYEIDNRLLIDLQQVIPLPEASDYQIRLREKETSERREARRRVQGEWEGDYYVNIDHGNGRSWEDCRKFGFVGASGGRRYIEALRKLRPGVRIYAYQKDRGYVGTGVVTAAAVPVLEFEFGGRPILDCGLLDSSMSEHQDDRDRCEWLCQVAWQHTRTLDDALRWPQMFANQNVVCRLRDASTLQRLRAAFQVAG